MKGFATLLFRAVLVAVCCFATFMSIRHARAEFVAAELPQGPALKEALRIEPENAEFVVANALLKSDDDDPSPTLDGELMRAARIDPLDSRLLMALGLRAEFRGDTAQARNYLARATELDHSFKPAWTYASFCVRNGQPDQFWPMARRCLSLDPLLFDPRPLFDLAWRISDDPGKIRGMLPQTGPLLIAYFAYLMDTNRIDAAAAIWPEALDALSPARPYDVALAMEYCNFMAAHHRMSNAVRAWNQMVDRHVIQSGHLDPANGISIADPDFRFPPNKGLFGWTVTEAGGVFVTNSAGAIRLELDGDEPEALTLMSTTAPVLPQKAYRLSWKYDSSQLSSAHDSGFDVRIVQQPGNQPAACAPFLKSGEEGACSFVTGSDVQGVGIELRYVRASGTTRARGTLVISDVRLGFGS